VDMTMVDLTAAFHIGNDDIPFVVTEDGNYLKVLQVNRSEGLWVTEVIFAKSFNTPRHRHTGPVWGYTFSGAWHYLEYDYINRAGSFIYEPANSEHTLEILEDGTHALFLTWGSNLNLGDDGSIISTLDGGKALARYYALAEQQGMEKPSIILV
jgi:2,4'-dihydroxyacetophenone dioxygenase